MKKFLSLMLVIVMLLAVVSCNSPTPDGDNGAGNNDQTQQNGDQTENGGDDPVEEVNPFEQKTTQFTIVYPKNSPKLYEVFAKKLSTAIADKTGCEVGITTDNTSKDTSNQNYEILLGETDRKESLEISAPAATFAIKACDKKIVIKGYTDDQVFCGIVYFINNYIGSSEDGKLFTVSKDLDVVQRGNPSVALYLDLGENVVSDVLTPTRVITLNSRADKTGQITLNCMQGGCTDGEYFYFLITDGRDDENDQTRVVKYDPRTNRIVKTGPIISVAHANDLTYDSKNDRFVVAWCSIDNFCVSYIDPETLGTTGNGMITGHTIGCFGIAYDPVTNTYACAESNYKVNGYGLLILNEKLKLITRLDGGGVGHTAQGVDCDDKYIYYSQSPGGGNNNNVIRVYDRATGKLVKQFTIALTYEIEHVFWYNGAFYAGFNCSGSSEGKLGVYRLDISLNLDNIK